MKEANILRAAKLLWLNWKNATRIDALPSECRPADRASAYAIQAAVARESGQKVFGWKIAATSAAGQRHIGVDGPLAGRLLEQRVFDSGARVALTGNAMRVAEAEFAFRMGETLPPRATPYSTVEVMNAVAALHPAIEIPDSRYNDFVTAGAEQLIADNACASWFVLGTEARDWRKLDLIKHRVVAHRNGRQVRDGSGANVLGDPKLALTWIANELCANGASLQAGEVVTTGTCVVPVEIEAADHVTADFGAIGAVEVRLT
jgi:2-keto-4-pentenoate hydratase